MEFYKSDKIFSKIGMKYTGLKIEAGDIGKVITVGPDLISILWDKDKRQLARLTPPNNILKTSIINYEDFKKKAFYDKIKTAQSPKTLAKQFMADEDYDNFSKLIDLRKLYSEENIGRNMEGLKGTKEKIKDINEKIDSILDKYKNVIMNEFDLKAKENYINKIVKKAKVNKWTKDDKKKEVLKSNSIDKSNKKEDIEVDNLKPNESNVTDYGQEPLTAPQERQ